MIFFPKDFRRIYKSQTTNLLKKEIEFCFFLRSFPLGGTAGNAQASAGPLPVPFEEPDKSWREAPVWQQPLFWGSLGVFLYLRSPFITYLGGTYIGVCLSCLSPC
ncbi:hypothetical protein CDAR_508431 [Caerostris darwini]|uniref:Uncharacterized protein n=1 Tax=Caerostris darwini TaxID=1538125 RepID=A0AAV4N361_9ARAC|nr:hypothetical protein CDAR_508431 [Caerostris darwini]